MNILICLITVRHIIINWEIKYSVPRKSSLLIYVGVLAPLGDYILRIFLGEIWFQTSGLIFHSFAYHVLFWGLIALLHWVYWRNIKQAITWLVPLLGLLLYAIFSTFSTEMNPFLAPFSKSSVSLNWVNAGYLIPLILIAILWITKKWNRLSRLAISRISLSIVLLFVVFFGAVQMNIKRMVTDSFTQTRNINITPANFVPLDWDVVAYQENRYQVSHYNLIKGWRREANDKDAFHNFEMSQSILLNPRIFQIYSTTFKNPVISTSVQNETMMIEISELIPSSEILWVDNLQLIINRTGQIIDYNVDYRTIRL